MPRWDPEAERRLHDAAIELFLEHGYENVTVSEIADRAGLTRRTFSRYFADKRDVLFAGADDLPRLLAEALDHADPRLPPFEAVLTALDAVGGWLEDAGVEIAAQRRAVAARSPELQERGRTKFAAVADALAAGLVRRGSEAADAALLGDVAVAVFRSGFDRWIDDPTAGGLVVSLREASRRLTESTTWAEPAETRLAR